MLTDLGLAPKAFAEELDGTLRFGDLEPLVCELQQTPVERLQSTLATKLRGGLPLKTLVAAGALANARTFGGEDYIGFDTFMALGPALKMSALMPKGSEALPVFKVLYRNSNRIQEFGGRESETLHALSASTPVNEATAAALRAAILAQNTNHAEQILAALVADDRQVALDALIPAIRTRRKCIIGFAVSCVGHAGNCGNRTCPDAASAIPAILSADWNRTVAPTGTNPESCW